MQELESHICNLFDQIVLEVKLPQISEGLKFKTFQRGQFIVLKVKASQRLETNEGSVLNGVNLRIVQMKHP